MLFSYLFVVQKFGMRGCFHFPLCAGTFDKDARRKIHHAIDEHFGRFLEAKTQPGYGPESVIRVRLRKKKSAAQSSFNDGFRYCSEFLSCPRVTKSNICSESHNGALQPFCLF